VLNQAREALMNQWFTYSEIKRDFLTIAAFAFAYREGTRGFGYDSNLPPDKAEARWPVRRVWDDTLRNSVWSLREMPINRSHSSMTIDYRLKPDWSLSAFPRLPWKSVKDKQPVEYHMQGAFIYPIFEGHGNSSNFVWKDTAMPLILESNKRQRPPGGDYLYTYWMARWSGLIGDDSTRPPRDSAPNRQMSIGWVMAPPTSSSPKPSLIRFPDRPNPLTKSASSATTPTPRSNGLKSNSRTTEKREPWRICTASSTANR
jgi:hypothetical protein